MKNTNILVMEDSKSQSEMFLILLDYNMHGMDGMKVLRAVKRINPRDRHRHSYVRQTILMHYRQATRWFDGPSEVY